MFPEAGPETARRALASVDAEIANAKIDLAAIYTNDYAKRANAKYPKG
jgi:NitT/TauT family transport system substrate-binding protein